MWLGALAVGQRSERLKAPRAWYAGVVIAKLFLGDVVGAQQYFEALAGQVDRSARDLRTRLLKAYLQALEKPPERPASASSVAWTYSDTSPTHKRDDALGEA